MAARAARDRGLDAVAREFDLDGRRPVDGAAEQLTPNAAMVELHRARRALGTRLDQSCRTCATHGCLDSTCGGAAGRRRDENPL